MLPMIKIFLRLVMIIHCFPSLPTVATSNLNYLIIDHVFHDKGMYTITRYSRSVTIAWVLTHCN